MMSAQVFAGTPVQGIAAKVARDGAARGGRNLSSPLRLTRRGRLVLFGLPLMIMAAVLMTAPGYFNSPATAADTQEALETTETVTYTVAPGDTVWKIAEVVAGDADPRNLVQGIMELNGLESSTIHVGQQLYVPTGE